MDGLLVWYAGIVEGIGLDRGKTFFDRYQGLPLMTIGGRLKNLPDLSIDNYQGVRSTVEHLIKVHDRRHIAMIRGPKGHPDADERYRSYVEALQAHNLPVNPDYVAETCCLSSRPLLKSRRRRFLDGSRSCIMGRLTR